MKHILKLANTSKNGLKVFYINFELKRPKIKVMSLRNFFKIINKGLTSKHYKYLELDNIYYHKKRITFDKHYKFFLNKKHALRVLKKTNYLINKKKGIYGKYDC